MSAKACWPCQLVFLSAALATLAQINAAEPSSSSLPEVESLSLHEQNGLQRIHDRLLQAAHAADTVVTGDADAVVPEESDVRAESQPSELAQAAVRDNDDTNDSTDGGHGTCFPQQAQVDSESRGRVPIGSVGVGERLMTLGGYSEVCCCTHTQFHLPQSPHLLQVLFFAVRQLDVVSRCITIRTDNVTLALTGSHAVFTADGAPIQATFLADTVPAPHPCPCRRGI